MEKTYGQFVSLIISFLVFAGLVFVSLNLTQYNSLVIVTCFFSSILALTACVYRVVDFWESKRGKRAVFDTKGIAEILAIDQHYEKGKSYHLQGKTKQAIREFKRILTLDPNDSDVYYQLGKIYQERGKIKEATKFFEQYLEMDKEKKWKEEVEQILPSVRKEPLDNSVLS